MSTTINPHQLRQAQTKALAACLDKFVARFDTPARKRLLPFFLPPAAQLANMAISATASDSLLARKTTGLHLEGAVTILRHQPQNSVGWLVAQALDHSAFVLLSESGNQLRERWEPIHQTIKRIAAINIDPPAVKKGA